MPILLPGEQQKTRKEMKDDLSPPGFLLPNVPKAAEFCSTNFGAHYDDAHQMMKFSKGTTTLAFKYQGGIIVSVDSRATQGQFIGAFHVVPSFGRADPL